MRTRIFREISATKVGFLGCFQNAGILVWRLSFCSADFGPENYLFLRREWHVTNRWSFASLYVCVLLVKMSGLLRLASHAAENRFGWPRFHTPLLDWVSLISEDESEWYTAAVISNRLKVEKLDAGSKLALCQLIAGSFSLPLVPVHFFKPIKD